MNLLDASLLAWSRAQFAMTAMYHWLFVPLTLGLGLIMCIMESLYVKNGQRSVEKSDPVLDDAFRSKFCHWCGNRDYPGI